MTAGIDGVPDSPPTAALVARCWRRWRRRSRRPMAAPAWLYSQVRGGCRPRLQYSSVLRLVSLSPEPVYASIMVVCSLVLVRRMGSGYEPRPRTASKQRDIRSDRIAYVLDEYVRRAPR
jgi:hypothetical protein